MRLPRDFFIMASNQLDYFGAESHQMLQLSDPRDVNARCGVPGRNCGLRSQKIVSRCSGRLLQNLGRLEDVRPLYDKWRPIYAQYRPSMSSDRTSI